MGPFPHDAPRSEISEANPADTDGFEFVEFAHPNPDALRDTSRKMGYAHVANHKIKKIELWQQDDVSYLLNAEPNTHAAGFIAEPYVGDGKSLDVPAIVGIGGSLIYFIDQYFDTSPYNNEFDWIGTAHFKGVGFFYLDHLTHKCSKETWTRGSSSTATCSISAKSASSTSRESIPDFIAEP